MIDGLQVILADRWLIDLGDDLDLLRSLSNG